MSLSVSRCVRPMISKSFRPLTVAMSLGTEARYQGVPSCAYRVGDYIINKNGFIEGDLEAIRDFLTGHGIIQHS